MIACGKRLALARRGASEVTHLELDPDDGNPKYSGQDVQGDRYHNPALAERVSSLLRKRHSGDRLGYDSRGREQEIRQHNDASYRGDHSSFARQMSAQHEESDSGARAKQHRRSDHMQKFESEIERHLSPRMASATICNNRIGKIFNR